MGKLTEVHNTKACPVCKATDGFVYIRSKSLKICDKGHAAVFMDYTLKPGQKSILIEGLVG